MIQDTRKRLLHLRQRMEQSISTTSPDSSLSDTSLSHLSAFITGNSVACVFILLKIIVWLALEKKDWNGAKQVHTQMMQLDYEREGKWVLGMKRLLDLLTKCP